MTAECRKHCTYASLILFLNFGSLGMLLCRRKSGGACPVIAPCGLPFGILLSDFRVWMILVKSVHRFLFYAFENSVVHDIEKFPVIFVWQEFINGAAHRLDAFEVAIG